MDSLEGLNEAQRLAVAHTHGPLFILAGEFDPNPKDCRFCDYKFICPAQER